MSRLGREGNFSGRGVFARRCGWAETRKAAGETVGLARNYGFEIAHDAEDGEEARDRIAAAQTPAQRGADEAAPHAGPRDRRAPTRTLPARPRQHRRAQHDDIADDARHARERVACGWRVSWVQ